MDNDEMTPRDMWRMVKIYLAVVAMGLTALTIIIFLIFIAMTFLIFIATT